VAARKSERLMNLVICLLVARTYVAKSKIRDVVEAYRDQSDDAFEKMFERDKDELKDLGVPIELGFADKAFEDEPGYRIRRSAFELPEVVLDPDEAAVIGLAARVWQHARLAEVTSSALVKLRAAGVEVDTSALAVVEPHVAASEPAFEPIWDAVVTRTPVRFDYQRSGEGEAHLRTVEPWGIVSWHGHWYAVGHDRDRGAARMFRLSRVVGPVKRVGKPGSYDVPAGTDLRKLAAQLAPADPTGSALVRVRSGAGFGLRRRATKVLAADEGWDELELPFPNPEAMADDVLPYGADVVVLEPDRVRQLVVQRLRALAEPVG
jgi:proteasome accessory factor B